MELENSVMEPVKIHIDPDYFYKMGTTELLDALERFDEEYHANMGLRGICLGRDYNVECIWTAYVSKREGARMENNYWGIKPLNLDINHSYNGASECRYLTLPEITEIRKYLYGYRKTQPFIAPGPNRTKLYLMKFTKKAK